MGRNRQSIRGGGKDHQRIKEILLQEEGTPLPKTILRRYSIS